MGAQAKVYGTRVARDPDVSGPVGVIGEVDGTVAGNTLLRVGRVTDAAHAAGGRGFAPSWQQTEHVVLDPAETVALGRRLLGEARDAQTRLTRDVALWLDNDERTHRDVRELVGAWWTLPGSDDGGHQWGVLARALRAYVRDVLLGRILDLLGEGTTPRRSGPAAFLPSEVGNGLALELLTTALDYVEWDVLAREYATGDADLQILSRVAELLSVENPAEPGGEWSMFDLVTRLDMAGAVVRQALDVIAPHGGRYVGGTSGELYAPFTGEAANARIQAARQG